MCADSGLPVVERQTFATSGFVLHSQLRDRQMNKDLRIIDMIDFMLQNECKTAMI